MFSINNFLGIIPVFQTVLFILEVIAFRKYYSRDKANSEFIFLILGLAQIMYAAFFAGFNLIQVHAQVILSHIIASLISCIMGIVLVLRHN